MSTWFTSKAAAVNARGVKPGTRWQRSVIFNWLEGKAGTVDFWDHALPLPLSYTGQERGYISWLVTMRQLLQLLPEIARDSANPDASTRSLTRESCVCTLLQHDNQLTSDQGESSKDDEEEELIPRHPMPPPMPLPTNAAGSSAPPKRARHRTPLSPPPSDQTTRSSGRADRPDCKDLHSRGKPEGHTHMIRVLRTLSISDSLCLHSARAPKISGLSIAKPQPYKEARRSPEW